MTSPAPTTTKGGPQVLIFMIIGLGPAFLLGSLTGAGPAALVGAFVTLFGLMMVAGGPLWPDLRKLAAFAPVLVFAAVAPRLLGEVSRPAAFALITAIVVGAAMLPLRSSRLTSAGLGLGMLTLLAYSIPLMGAVTPGQLVLGAAGGLVTAAVLRLLMGIADPGAATRTAVAGVLDGPDPGFTTAFDLWLADGRRRWLADVLAAGFRYRVALGSAESLVRRLREPERTAAEAVLDGARARAGRVADLVRARSIDQDEHDGVVEVPAEEAAGEAGVVPAGVAELVAGVDEALDRAERAARRRDDDTSLPRDVRRRLGLDLLGTAARLRSIQLRHALRTGLGVLLALLITLRLRHGDPLMPTLLLTTFGILQASWQETLAKARPRIIGLVIGVVAVLVIVLLVPARAMTPIALVALVIALWNLTARPIVGYAALVCMSVGINSSLRQLDPTATLAEYATLTVLALLIGVVVGFAVIPGVRRRSLSERIDEATTATARSIRSLLRNHVEDPIAARTKVLGLQRDAVLARRDLVPDHDRLTDGQTVDLTRLRDALRDLSTLAVAAVDAGTDLSEMGRALAPLENRADPTPAPVDPVTEAEDADDGSTDAVVADVFVALAHEADQARRSLVATLETAEMQLR